MIISFFLLLLLSTFVMAGHVVDDTRLVASGLWTLYLTLMIFMILRTGRKSLAFEHPHSGEPCFFETRMPQLFSRISVSE